MSITRMYCWSIRAKAFLAFGVCAVLCAAYGIVLIYNLERFTVDADAVMAEQRFEDSLEAMYALDAGFKLITTAYLDAGSKVTRNTFDIQQEAFAAALPRARADAEAVGDEDTFEDILTYRLRQLDIEVRAVREQDEGNPAEADAILASTEYMQYREAFHSRITSEIEDTRSEIDQYETRRDARLAGTVRTAYLLLLAILVLGGAITYVLVDSILRRIRMVEEAAIAISSGNTQVRAEVASGDEVGRMAIAFNKMAIVLDESSRERLREITKAIGQ